MKNFNLILLSWIVLFSMQSCSKCPEECATNQVKVLGACKSRAFDQYLFGAYPDFYCFNDSIVLGYSKDKSNHESIIYLRHFQYLENKGQGNNWLIGGLRSSDHVNEFYEQCWDNPKQGVTYHTFLYVEDFDKITKETKELKGILELRSSQYAQHSSPIHNPKVVLDSSTVILRRLN